MRTRTKLDYSMRTRQRLWDENDGRKVGFIDEDVDDTRVYSGAGWHERGYFFVNGISLDRDHE